MSLESELAATLAAHVGTGQPFPFEEWALRVFAHQHAENAPYRAFCDRRGVTPATVASWEDVPAVPTAAFRRVDLVCGTPQMILRTSGTTAGWEQRGRHLIPEPALYRAAALPAFARFMLPDRARLPFLLLVPSLEVRPDSSLVHMCEWVSREFGASAEWFLGADGLDLPRLLARLSDAHQRGEAVLVVGVTAAFARLFATCRERNLAFRLAPGSRIMDTGGQKGMDRPLSRAGFLRDCWSKLGIAGYYCINEYGMTELCSQRYDSVLDDRFHGRSLAPRRLVGPPWLRTRVLDPDTLRPVTPGELGLLCHHDLANAGSVSVVLTEDLGRAVEDGIEVTGRVAGALPRGCGLLLADLEGRACARGSGLQRACRLALTRRWLPATGCAPAP